MCFKKTNLKVTTPNVVGSLSSLREGCKTVCFDYFANY